uniref:G_PROTEIN_RECEP_F1_2 domain-containing protein n=1 Tax=Ascaris lumbricoides TaxID=6252 RepID=A0A0M3HU28_ASCLU
MKVWGYASRSRNEHVAFAQYDSRFDLTEFDDPSTEKGEQVSTLTASVLATASGPLLLSASSRQRFSNMGRECHSMADLTYPKVHLPPARKNTEANVVPLLTKTAQLCHNRLLPQNLLAKAQDHYQTYGPGRIIRGSKEKMVYLRERKALKTIGIVVLGFIICWMPFFVLYLIEVFVEHVIESRFFYVFSELFLWLGYSNSVLNPIIYTMYNGDFRRCFRDLLSFGCVQQHRRTMSVKKLHQQSTTF